MLDHAAAGPLPAGALSAADQELVEAARGVLLQHYRPFWHTIGCALRGRDGRVWTGLHLGATVGRLSICAEAVALGRAVMDGDGTVECIVAVRHPKPEVEDRTLRVVPPCGACRENLLDFDRGAAVIVPSPTGLIRTPILALLPLPYQR